MLSTRSQRRGERQIVSDENRRELVRSVQAFQQVENHLAGPEIQIPGRFIGEQDGGSSDQSARQYHPLLLSARQFACAV